MNMKLIRDGTAKNWKNLRLLIIKFKFQAFNSVKDVLYTFS